MPLTPQIGSSISPTTVSTRWSICKSSLTQFAERLFSYLLQFPSFLPVDNGADDQENANKPTQNICECWIKKLWHALCKQSNVGSNKCKQGYKYRQAITLSTTRRLARKMATSGDWKLFGRYNHFHFHCHLHFYSLWTLKLTFFDLTLIESPKWYISICLTSIPNVHACYHEFACRSWEITNISQMVNYVIMFFSIWLCLSCQRMRLRRHGSESRSDKEVFW